VQHFAGSVGPADLSSGGGTPKWRGNWQNTLEAGPYTLTLTAYYVSRIKQVAADEIAPVNGQIDLSCKNNLNGTSLDGTGEAFCYAKSFIDLDLNASVKVTDNFTFSANISNLLNAKAPVVPQSYSGVNYLPTWHINGVVGRAFRASANFKF
jgi:iron complex outermembrane receptor protein